MSTQSPRVRAELAPGLTIEGVEVDRDPDPVYNHMDRERVIVETERGRYAAWDDDVEAVEP